MGKVQKCAQRGGCQLVKEKVGSRPRMIQDGDFLVHRLLFLDCLPHSGLVYIQDTIPSFQECFPFQNTYMLWESLRIAHTVSFTMYKGQQDLQPSFYTKEEIVEKN